jgi:protein-ribulosamine 3-kinase
MNDKFIKEVEKVLNLHINTGEKIVSTGASGGGCINNGTEVITDKGNSYFVKYNSRSPEDMFTCEMNGLEEMRKSKAIRVPQVFGVGGGIGSIPCFIILEHIKGSRRLPDFYEDFGRKFAQMHRYTSNRYGFYEDNYIGSTPQKNTYENDWVEFYRKHRLGFQIDLARKRGLARGELSKKMDILIDRLDEFIGGIDEPPAVLHGDLWGGNHMVGDDGHVVLIDPATYYGSREADLAMTDMFGSMPTPFYQAYDEAYPLADGYNKRKLIYQLYHYLNHLNLFGGGYLGSCLSIVNHFV